MILFSKLKPQIHNIACTFQWTWGIMAAVASIFASLQNLYAHIMTNEVEPLQVIKLRGWSAQKLH
jgi:hypothetical protein